VLEVSLIGPGYGESIIIHLAAGDWIVVDSSVERSGAASALTYLNQIAVDPASAVRAVVASHWDDDHVRGLSQVVAACELADVVLSAALSRREFQILLEAAEPRSMSSASGLREMYDVHSILDARWAERCAEPILAAEGDPIWERDGSDAPRCRVQALAPSATAIIHAQEAFAREIGIVGAPKRVFRRFRPNHASVPLWVTVGDDHILLGADLERLPDESVGWRGVLNAPSRPNARAAILKVPHHGGESGDHLPMWEELLLEEPIAILTPFARGRPLPTLQDKQRLCRRTMCVFVSANERSRSRRRRSGPVERQIRQTVRGMRVIEPPGGHIRLRRRIGTSDPWSVELFPPAYHACAATH